MASLHKKIKLLAQVNLDRQFYSFFAESGGFEPSIRLRVYRISSAALSTTQTTFLQFKRKGTAFFSIIQIQSAFFYGFSILPSTFNAPPMVLTC